MSCRTATAGLLLLALSSTAAVASAQLPAGHPNPAQPSNAAEEQAQRQQADALLQHSLKPAQVAAAQPSAEVPKGTVRVSVIDSQGQPAAGAPVRIGIMLTDSKRDQLLGKTNSEGVFEAQNQPTGSNQSYRVTVEYNGAKYGSSPFQLPPDRGYDVRIRRLDTTTKDQSVFQFLGQTMLEFADDRLRVTQQAVLVNLAQNTYVFPKDGVLVDLPEGFTAFRAQAVMTDQRMVARDGEGFIVQGSLPPGRVTLTWTFDLPIEDTEMTIEYGVPWRTFEYRVMADGASGVELDVKGMPAAQEADHRGRAVLATAVRRGPRDPAFDFIEISLRGIPGPGPYRWIAVAGALLFVLAGLGLAFRTHSDPESRRRALEARQDELLNDAKELERLYAQGEVGPEHRARRREAILSELAWLLRRQEGERASR